MKKKIVVANLKMYLSFDESLAFVTDHLDELASLAEGSCSVVLCPSFVALYPLAQILKSTALFCGAQDCAEYHHGAYTGQVAADSLREVGCTHCIIGHNERRTHQKESDVQIAQKFQALIDVGLVPMICVGESEKERAAGKTFQVLEQKLERILTTALIERSKIKMMPLCIAYEPVWAIGTGQVVTRAQLTEVLEWLHAQVCNKAPGISWKFLYGGSVKPENLEIFRGIEHFDGFLVGNASADFQSLKKIVEWAKQ